MKPRSHDPRRLDVAALAVEGGQIHGHWPLSGMPRVLASEMSPTLDGEDGATGPGEADGAGRDAEPQVEWTATGESRAMAGGARQTWMHLRAHAVVRLQCQRCLAGMDVPLDVERAFRFVADETAAERLDEEIEDEVLVLSRSLDLHELVEDELLLAMPIVPRHDVCPEAPPLVFGDGDDAGGGEEDGSGGDGGPPHPFAALAALKKQGSGGSTG